MLPSQNIKWLQSASDQLLDIGIKPYLAQYSPIPGTPLGDIRLRQLKYQDSGELLMTNKILSVYSHPGWSQEEYLSLNASLKHRRDRIQEVHGE